MRDAPRRATLRAAASSRPSSRQWPSDTSSGRPRAAASAARPKRGSRADGLDRQRLVREQLAIAGDGQRVVVEVDAVHVVGSQMLVGKLTLESALYCRSGGSSSGAMPS